MMQMELLKLPKVLIRYGKSEKLKYLSHLELARAFERAFRRAGIEVQRSGGFNPRPKISHGPALPVGVGSSSEYMCAEIKELVSVDVLQEKLSSVLPKGLPLYGAKYIEGKQPSIISTAQSAAYRVVLELTPSTVDIASLIEQFIKQERLLLKHKKNEKWVETKKAILDWKIDHADDSRCELYLLLSLGDENSTRPSTLIEKLSETYPQLGKVVVLDIYRIEQYVNRVIPLINIYDFYEGVTMGSERN